MSWIPHTIKSMVANNNGPCSVITSTCEMNFRKTRNKAEITPAPALRNPQLPKSCNGLVE